MTLLLGNHDVHYFESYPFFSRGGRMSHERFEEIRSIFMENLDLFDLAKCICCDKGLPYLFTHAGVRTRWIEANVRYIERKRLEVLIISKILMLNGNVSRAQNSAVQAILYLIDTQVIENECISHFLAFLNENTGGPASKEKPGFITSTYVWERNDRDCTANI